MPKTPRTSFGRAAQETGFARVCPKCGKQWVRYEQWIADTAVVAHAYRTVVVALDPPIKEGKKERKEKTQRWVYTVRGHLCGGEMLAEHPHKFVDEEDI